MNPRVFTAMRDAGKKLGIPVALIVASRTEESSPTLEALRGHLLVLAEGLDLGDGPRRQAGGLSGSEELVAGDCLGFVPVIGLHDDRGAVRLP